MTRTIPVNQLIEVNTASIAVFISKIEKAVKINESLYSRHDLNGKEILLENIFISVIIKEIHLREKISELEKNIFRQFLKNETEYKIFFEGTTNIFYRDFIIDNLDNKPQTDFDFSLHNIHQKFEKLVKTKSILELRLILSILTLTQTN